MKFLQEKDGKDNGRRLQRQHVVVNGNSCTRPRDIKSNFLKGISAQLDEREWKEDGRAGDKKFNMDY